MEITLMEITLIKKIKTKIKNNLKNNRKNY